METKIGFIFNSIYMMLIPNRFIYLFIYLIFHVKPFFFLFNEKEGFRNKVFSSHSMSHYNKRRYHFY